MGFLQLDECAHLAGPGRGVLRIVFEHLREGAERLLEVCPLEGALRLGQVELFVLCGQSLWRLLLEFTAELQIAKTAHELTSAFDFMTRATLALRARPSAQARSRSICSSIVFAKGTVSARAQRMWVVESCARP